MRVPSARAAGDPDIVAHVRKIIADADRDAAGVSA